MRINTEFVTFFASSVTKLLPPFARGNVNSTILHIWCAINSDVSDKTPLKLKQEADFARCVIETCTMIVVL